MKTGRLLYLVHFLPTLVPTLNLVFMFGIARGIIHVTFALPMVLWLASWMGGAGVINLLAQRLAEPLRRSHLTNALIALCLPMGMPFLVALYDGLVTLERSGGHAPIGGALGRLGLAIMLEFGCLLITLVMGIWGVIQLLRQREYWEIRAKQ